MTIWAFIDKNSSLLVALIILLSVIVGLLTLIGRVYVVPKIRKFFESFESLSKTVTSIETRLSIMEAQSVSAKDSLTELKKDTQEHLHLLGKMTETNIVEMKSIIMDMANQVADLRETVFAMLKEHYKNHPSDDE